MIYTGNIPEMSYQHKQIKKLIYDNAHYWQSKLWSYAQWLSRYKEPYHQKCIR